MSSIVMVPGFTSAQLFVRSMAVNIPLGLVAVGTFAGVYGVLNLKPRSAKRKDFLRVLAESPALSTETLMTLHDAVDPVALVRLMLADKDTPADLSIVLRKALMLMI